MRTPEEQLVDASLDMGKALLLAGGEVTRVEDTITRILHAYGMHKVGVFTITSLIEVTGTHAGRRRDRQGPRSPEAMPPTSTG